MKLRIAAEETAHHPGARPAASVHDPGDASDSRLLHQFARIDAGKAAGAADDVQIIARQHDQLAGADRPGPAIVERDYERAFHHIVEANNVFRLDHIGLVQLWHDLAGNALRSE